MAQFRHDLDKIKKLAEDYTKKCDFMRDYRREYDYVKKNKLQDEVFGHIVSKPINEKIFPTYLPLEEKMKHVKKITALFTNRIDFRAMHKQLDKWIMKYKVQEDVFSHFPKKKTDYTLEEIMKITEKYTRVSDIYQEDSCLYNYIKEKNLENLAYAHMPYMNRPINMSIDQIVELSKLYPSRMHFKAYHQALYKRIKKEKIDKIVLNHYPKREKSHYTNEELSFLASQYTNMTSFNQADPYAVAAIYQRKLHKEYCAHMVSLKRKPYTNEELILIGKNYTKRSAFRKKEGGPYVACIRRGILDEVCEHMETLNYYSDEDFFDITAKYTKRSQFRKFDSAAYTACHKRGLLDLVCDHMEESASKKIEDSELKERALKFHFRSECEQYDRAAYFSIIKRKLADEYFSHMMFIEPPPLSDEDIFKLAEPYDSKRDFRNKHRRAHSEAVKRGIITEVCSHMIDRNVMEKRVLKFVQEKYQTADSKAFNKINVKDHPYIKGFQLDIYISEINRAIEFDGTYWHSFECMQKSKPHWPEQSIRDYHEIKDDYFQKEHGIIVLHIKEEDWLENEEACKNRILSFLTS